MNDVSTVEPPHLAGTQYAMLVGFFRDPIKALELGIERSSSDIFTFKNGERFIVCSRRPEDAQFMLVDGHRHFSKHSRGYELLRLILGNGLLTSEGELWRRQRRIANPAFHQQRIASFADTMVIAAEQMVDGWQGAIAHRSPIDIAREMMRVTLRIVGETMLGFDPSGDADLVGKSISFGLQHVSRRMSSPLIIPETWPLPSNLRFRRSIEHLDRVVLDMIKTRRASPDTGTDLLAMLMDARDEETGEGMTDAQLRDEVMTMFLAGHETTAANLAWTIDLLARNPSVLRAAQHEVDTVLKGRSATFADLTSLPLLDRVVKESLRLYPPVPMLARRAEEDFVMNGYRVRKGAFVLLPTYLIHRHPTYWASPDRFDPDRFLSERQAQITKGAFLPFSLGTRKCIGDAFALMEARLVLSVVLQRTEVFPCTPEPPHPQVSVTLRPRGGLPSHVTRRQLGINSLA